MASERPRLRPFGKARAKWAADGSRAASTTPGSVDPSAPVAAAEIESFADAQAYLLGLVILERLPQDGTMRDVYKLDRMVALCAALGEPQRQFRSVHIAGTKGKGSVCELTAAMLIGSGMSVGMYTSPHILDIRERIRIGSRQISAEAFAAICRQVAIVAERVEAQLDAQSAPRDPTDTRARRNAPTFFEIMTAMAFVYFAQQAVDLAVIEVGLGGLLDCTNVIVPEVAAISLIGYDHMAVLGNTLAEIAAQKAGIFKPDVPALSFVQDPAVLSVFAQTAAAVGCPLKVVGRDLPYAVDSEPAKNGRTQWMVSIKTPRFDVAGVPVPLAGRHQAHNLALALGIIDTLAERGHRISEAGIIKGLERCVLAGRFEVLPTSPRIVLDVAHNPESVHALMQTLRENLQFDSLIMVFGCASDKDWEAMLGHLATGCDKVIFTKAAGSPRAAEATKLYKSYRKIHQKMAQVGKTMADALRMARAAAGAGDIICIAGSFYLVGEAKKLLKREGAQGKTP